MIQINNARDVYNAVKEYITRPEQEEVFIVSMDGKMRVKSITFAALGDIDECTMPKRFIYYKLCTEMATAAILVHTHPSGNPTPSRSDVKSTEGLRAGLDTLGIKLLDHVIIGDKCCYSFAEKQTINE